MSPPLLAIIHLSCGSLSRILRQNAREGTLDGVSQPGPHRAQSLRAMHGHNDIRVDGLGGAVVAERAAPRKIFPRWTRRAAGPDSTVVGGELTSSGVIEFGD